jgi:hypothetical protein
MFKFQNTHVFLSWWHSVGVSRRHFSVFDIPARMCYKRSMIASEHENQVALFQWMKLHEVTYPALKNAFAIPNGTRTSPRVAARMKAEGVLKGVSDIFLPHPAGKFHGLFIELKAGKGRASPEQKAFIAAMMSAGYCAEVVTGWEAAAMLIIAYLEERVENNNWHQGL